MPPRKPDWLRTRPPSGERFAEVRSTLREHDLVTVCEEASCPNRGECWSGRDGPGTATVMLMGDRCTRGCAFCDVATGDVEELDADEPERVADAVAAVGLDYVVLTSVDRDDLADGGASHVAATVSALKRRDPDVLVEVLAPDFGGDREAVATVLDAGPDVFAHNLETVERRQRPVRDPRAGYEQSLAVLEQAARESDAHVKTSLMLGVGEYAGEVYEALADCRAAGVEVVTLGQYLRPSARHLPVETYVHPATFETWRRVAEDELGFAYCAAGPLVRSSYRAGEVFVEALTDGASPDAARAAARSD